MPESITELSRSPAYQWGEDFFFSVIQMIGVDLWVDGEDGGKILSAEGVARISISLPRDLLDEFDTIVKSAGQDRSKAIQQSMRNYITEHRWDESLKSKVSGVIVMLLDHDTPGLEDELTDIQHDFLRLINSTTHVHLDERICLETLVVRGKTSEIRSLIEALSSKRILQLRHMIVG